MSDVIWSARDPLRAKIKLENWTFEKIGCIERSNVFVSRDWNFPIRFFLFLFFFFRNEAFSILLDSNEIEWDKIFMSKKIFFKKIKSKEDPVVTTRVFQARFSRKNVTLLLFFRLVFKTSFVFARLVGVSWDSACINLSFHSKRRRWPILDSVFQCDSTRLYLIKSR